MKHVKQLYLLGVLSLAFSLGTTSAWSSRVFTDRVNGEITAVPVSSSIEVDHHVYRIKAGSAAAALLHGLSEGQKVELVLDGPVASKTSEVLMIKTRDAS